MPARAAYELNKSCRDYTVLVMAEGRHFDRMAEEAEQNPSHDSPLLAAVFARRRTARLTKSAQ